MAGAVDVVAVVPRTGAVDVAAMEVAVVCVCTTAGFVGTGAAFGFRIANQAMAAPMTRIATIAIGTTGGFFAGVATTAAGIAAGIDVGIDVGVATTGAGLSGFSSFAACGGSGACISIVCAGVATLVARRCMKMARSALVGVGL